MGSGPGKYLVKGLPDSVVGSVLHFHFCIIVTAPVLHPFIIGYDHATGISQDVRDDGDAAFVEDGVSVSGGGAVSALYDESQALM